MAKSTTLGTELYVESDTPDTYVKVGNVTSIGIPGPERTEIDVTDFDSTGSEFLPGFPDYGEMSFTVNYNGTDAGQIILFDDAQDINAGLRGFRIDFTQQDVRFTFEGFVRSFRPSASGIASALTADGAIRVSGAVTRTSPIPA